MTMDIDLKELATGRNFGALTTLRKDGSPSTQIVWVHATDEYVTINTEIARAKYRHIQRDPRVSVTVWDVANPYRYIEVIGRVTGEVRGPEARSNIDDLAKKYLGMDAYPGHITSDRVILNITVDKLYKYTA